MREYLDHLIFGLYPYIAFMVFIVGSIMRYEYAQYGWQTSSSQLLRSRGLRLGSNLFHIGIILLFFGHLLGLLIPTSMYSWFMTPAAKQLLAMLAGGIFGVLCFIGMTILIYRRLFEPRIRATSKLSDIIILLLLYVQLILGLASISVSAQHMDGSSMLALAHWAQYIVTFQPGAVEYIIHEHWIFKLHLFLGLTIFLIFPFTRLIHVWSVPLKYLFRSGYQIVRKRR